MRMLRLFLVGAMLFTPWTVTLRGAAMADSPAMAMADPPAPDAPAPNIDVHINEGATRVEWYQDPMILAVAGIGVLLLLILVATAVRGGGTTIIREQK